MRNRRNRRSSRSGNLMVFFGIALPFLLIPLCGLAIDATVARLMQVRLQASVDGAVLGAGRLLGSSADPETVAKQFFNSNFRTDGSMGTWGAHNPTVTTSYVNGITKIISLDAKAQVPLLFLRIWGLTDATIAASGQATRADSRVVLIVDRSGSMNTNDPSGKHTVIWDAIQRAAGFTQNFIAGTDELALVAYSSTAAVGYPNYTNYNMTIGTTGGPDRNFRDGTSTDMLHQINNIAANGYTNTAEALSLAYIELQKAHMRDLLVTGSPDTRLNAIVLLTDGVPNTVTINPNNYTNMGTASTPYYPYHAMKPTTLCANAMVTAESQQIYGVMTGPGWIPYSTNVGSNTLEGLYLTYAKDMGNHSSTWWMTNPIFPQASGYSPLMNSGPADVSNNYARFAGCTNTDTGVDSATMVQSLVKKLGKSASKQDVNYPSRGVWNRVDTSVKPPVQYVSQLNRIPDWDMWGNALNTVGYKQSQLVGNSNPSVYQRTMSQANFNNDYDWGMAAWNAVDNAALRIRTDSNKAQRYSDPDTMKTTIYTIGYTGNNGCDVELLKRVANDYDATSYDKTQPVGGFYQADDDEGMAKAFNLIAAAILRLAK